MPYDSVFCHPDANPLDVIILGLVHLNAVPGIVASIHVTFVVDIMRDIALANTGHRIALPLITTPSMSEDTVIVTNDSTREHLLTGILD